jgi:DNA helicase-2/ATP-dependent DNA helicase PcrA
VIDTLLSDHRQFNVQTAVAACGQPSTPELEHALAKSRLLTPERYLAGTRSPAAPVIAAVWEAVDAELQRANAWTFDDLLVAAVRLLREHPAWLAHLRGRWRWLLVDEMQDTNEAQATFVHLLAGAHGNLTVVGDADQAIYGFRCAEPRNILAFGERYPAHARIVLTHNFRSRAEIVDVAGACIGHNTRRHAKDLIAVRGRGGRVTTRGFALDRDEADRAAVVVADALATGTPPHEILVLARTGYATVPVQAALAAAGIPHRVLGSLGLYERAEVRDALAHLTVLANPADAQAYRRAVQAPRRGIGTATLGHLVTGARERFAGDLITASVRAHELGALRSAAIRERLIAFGTSLEAVREQYRAGRSLGHVVAAALMIDGGLVAHHETRRDRSPRPEQRRDSERVLEDLRSLCRAAQTFAEQVGSGASLTGFLEHAAGLHAEELAPGEDRRITVSTIHRANGTEAQLVILLGCEDGLLPSWRALEATDPDELEEERRLFYVAATRAKDHLVLTRCHVGGGRRTGGPSRFLAEAGLGVERHALAA